MGTDLRGNYYVVPTASAIHDAMALFPRYGDYQEARRHALKLAFWPKASDPNESFVEDFNWEWIRQLRSDRIGELRITDRIAGHDNLRIVFHVADKVIPGDPMPRVWTTSVVDKKSNDWTIRDIRSFRGRLKILRKRFYDFS